MVVLFNFFVNYIVLRLTVKVTFIGRQTGLMVSALDCRSRGLGTRQDLAKSMCCVLWQNTLLSQCLSPSPPTHPGVYMSICELSGKPDEIVEEGETL